MRVLWYTNHIEYVPLEHIFWLQSVSSHLSPLRGPYKYPLWVRVSITFDMSCLSPSKERETKAFTLPSSPSIRFQDQRKASNRKILGIWYLLWQRSSSSPHEIDLGTSKSQVLFSIALFKSYLCLKMQFFSTMHKI